MKPPLKNLTEGRAAEIYVSFFGGRIGCLDKSERRGILREIRAVAQARSMTAALGRLLNDFEYTFDSRNEGLRFVKHVRAALAESPNVDVVAKDGSER